MRNLEDFEKYVNKVFQENDVLRAGDLVVEKIRILLAQNYSREEMIRVLDYFRMKFDEEDNEKAEDMVLGIMDRLAGWTSSQFRL